MNKVKCSTEKENCNKSVVNQIDETGSSHNFLPLVLLRI